MTQMKKSDAPLYPRQDSNPLPPRFRSSIRVRFG
jgi:hypothetical protein